VHRWTTVGLIALGLPHLALIVLRDWRARASEALAATWQAMKGYALASAAWSCLLLLVTILLAYVYQPPRLMSAFPAGYELWQPKNPLYAKNREFAPSLARTRGNEPMDSRLLSGSRTCG